MRKLSLLLVEPDRGTRESMASVLRRRFDDAAIYTAESLRAALALECDPLDLVLTGWTLPDATGADVIHAMRQRSVQGVIVIADINCGSAAAEAVVRGATDYVVRHSEFLLTLPLVVEKNLAILRLQRERDTLHRQLTEQNVALEQLLKNLAEAAATDGLTNLYNRGHFAKVLEQMFDDAKRSSHDLSCVMFDMDCFKVLNDTFGHGAGDEALICVAQIVRDSLRKMDAAARYGGDEFVLLLPRSDALEAAGVARRIRDTYCATLKTKPYAHLPLGISFGVASLASDAPATADLLVAAADAALYRAKRMGRDRVYVSPSTPALTRAG